MFLTDNQWNKVGAVVSANPGMKEIVVNKDAFGNADVDFYGYKGFQHKHLRGNVIQFPEDRMAKPEPSRIERVLDGIADFMQSIYIEIGVVLGFLEDDSEEEAV
jgi:hypothetical protein